ncbi:MAG: hypothetical protein COU69_01540, partial [Candidatus Pacebacteria bacterium CG10_big_fil_rev_8_21_14_0_10_56_10]
MRASLYRLLPAVRSVIVGSLLLVLGGAVGFRIAGGATLPLANIVQRQVEYRLINTEQPPEVQDVEFSQFWEVWGILQQDYLDAARLNEQQMVFGAIRGMTAALGDPYTVFLPPELDQRTEEDLAGSFFGVGIELGYIDGTLAVVAPLKGMPADQAGVEAGDLILHVTDDVKGLDEDTQGWSLNQAVNNIRGSKQSTVTLTLFRSGNGGEPFAVNLIRDEIVIPSVELVFVEHDDKRVAHIQLSRFGERTKGEWDQIVAQILQQRDSVDGILLDMRNNPGGFFDGAIDVASEFIESGTIVTQQGKFTSRSFSAKGEAKLGRFPLRVLVNRGSASASEIVAGALRDRAGAELIGEQTFGKGTVQDRKQLDNGSGLHVTIARWLLPAGDSIQDEGVPVAIEVQDDRQTDQDEVVLRAI